MCLHCLIVLSSITLTVRICTHSFAFHCRCVQYAFAWDEDTSASVCSFPVLFGFPTLFTLSLLKSGVHTNQWCSQGPGHNMHIVWGFNPTVKMAVSSSCWISHPFLLRPVTQIEVWRHYTVAKRFVIFTVSTHEPWGALMLQGVNAERGRSIKWSAQLGLSGCFSHCECIMLVKYRSMEGHLELSACN